MGLFEHNQEYNNYFSLRIIFLSIYDNRLFPLFEISKASVDSSSVGGFFTIVSLIFFGSDGSSGTRYRVPLEPYLSVFAANGLIRLIKRYWPKSLLLRILE